MHNETTRAYKLLLAYDGTNYAGWQEQPGKRTISQQIRDSFLHVFKKDISIIGGSRTDAGVHALGQVARITTNFSLSAERIGTLLNNQLPQDILIRSCQKINDHFHPWYTVEQKTYYYHLFIDRPLPFLSRFGWYYSYKIDYKKFEQALSMFIGTHNFRSFTTGYDRGDDTIRTIDAITVHYIKRFRMYRIVVNGQKFTRHMIRRIIGAAVWVAVRPTISNDVIIQIRDACDPNHKLVKAPAAGLVLAKITYKQSNV